MMIMLAPPPPSPYPIPPVENAPSAWSGEALAGAQIDYAQYAGARQATSAVWAYNKSAFTAADTLDQLRGNTVGVFESVLTSMGLSLGPIISPLVVLGVLVALLALVVRPLLSVQVASVRYGVLVALVAVLMFPTMGLVYASLEALRFDIARELGATVFNAASGAQPADLPVYNPAAPNLLADVAASITLATPQDVQAPGAVLPALFTDSIITAPPSDWSTVDSPARQAYITQAGIALERMAHAIVPSTVLALDSLIQFVWSVAIGLAFLYLTVTLCFSVFVSFMQQVGRLCSWIFRAVLASWVLASVQAIVVSFMVTTASTGTSVQVAIVSLVVLLVYVFVLCVLGSTGSRSSCWVPRAPRLIAQK